MPDSRKYFGYTGESFSVQIFGQTIYLVLSEKDKTTIMSGHPGLDNTEHLRDLLKAFRTSPRGIVQTFQHPSPDISASGGILPNSKQKPMALLAEDIMGKQLLQNARFDDLMSRVLDFIDIRTQFETIPSSAVLNASVDNNKTVSLMKWAQYTMIEAVTVSWFGAAIWDISSTITTDMICLDGDIWKLLYQFPRLWSRDVQAALDRLHHCFLKYVRLHPSQKADQSWAARVTEEQLRLRALSDEDIAAQLMMVFWGYVYLLFDMRSTIFVGLTAVDSMRIFSR
jgi:hypothetical protein